MSEVSVLIFIGFAILASILMVLWWVRLVKSREKRLIDKEKEFKDSANYDSRLN